MPTAIRRYVRSLDLDAYVVGGAVRDELLGVPHADEDFLVPGVDQARLRALLEPHGRVEEMEVHGQLVGVRLHPRDRHVRLLAPAGIELTPPRAERSTGPGHRDFAIVSDPSIGIEEDMARRDFTVNAMARRLADGVLVDPFGGLGDLARRRLRTVSKGSFAEDPLRLVRAVRFVSQLGLEPTGETLTQMRLEAKGLDHVSAERIGGGLGADGLGELSKLLLGREPAKALRLARDTGVLVQVIPELEPSLGFELGSERQPVPLDEHVFRVVQAAADAEAPLAVRLAALLHDTGKPAEASVGESHAALSAVIARRVTARLRYPTRLRHRVEHIVRHHSFPLDGPSTASPLVGSSPPTATTLRSTSSRTRTPTWPPRRSPREELDAVVRLRAELEHQRESPHRVSDLAVHGDDLKALGLREGPEVGRILRLLLDEVVEDPGRNERAWLLARATKEIA